ncbi:MAG: 50S ribosomal protein L19 [Candidatus Blackburnbacteria bacterium RIFCSPHIGHO2_01_FULL_43_15b]|uniref:50S ribosomal protein L19 n=1 Tax=Candidatus Blackburnbacteria bacterium RIFCSPHIGHO2_01_FULL_43_15b TaxID=1797513 RepID=A0A1G1V2S4_9BACT|nr:MAG: 50S ribosomal protein L19 [Candidatus Blackburnbacteria bacterium RIFCSPHIGHO2_01_FULL_43_15b]
MSLSVTHKNNTFNVGDTIRVWQTIKEQTAKGGERTRLQAFEGIVIASRGHGDNKSFTVRRAAVGGIGVERIFPVNSPLIDRVDVTNRGIVRRSKLYYLRQKSSREVAEVTKRYARLKAAQTSAAKKSK